MTKTAFVLTGEGAKGAWQAGALLALRTKHYTGPDAIYGVSSGAVNAIGFALAGPEELYEIWRNITGLKSVFAFNKLSFLWATGLFNSKPIRKVLSKFIGNKFQCDVSVPAVDAISGDIIWSEFKAGQSYPADKIDKAFGAAIAISCLVEASDGMIDGGCRILAPLKRAIDEGADEIYIITGRPLGKNPPFDGKGLWLGGMIMKAATYGYRSVDLLMHQIILNDLQTARWVNLRAETPEFPNDRIIKLYVVEPSDHVGGALEFNKAAANVLKGLNEATIKDVTV
jgi:predicted acylesterase/phospholipase RssA